MEQQMPTEITIVPAAELSAQDIEDFEKDGWKMDYSDNEFILFGR